MMPPAHNAELPEPPAEILGSVRCVTPAMWEVEKSLARFGYAHCKEVVQQANGLLRSYWRSAKVRVPTAGDVDAPSDSDEPEPPEDTFT
jgi:hypothetical protein